MMERKALQKKGEQLIVKEITPMVKLIKSIIPSREYEIMKEEEVKPIMKQLKERINPELAETQKHRILSVLDRHQKAFSMNSQDIGFVRADLCPITIDIGNEQVPYHQPYPLSLAKRKRMNSVIKELLESGIIEESDAPGGAPALLVPRSNGKDRLVVDYRALNRLIERKQYPMPKVDDCLEAMRGQPYFALIDLAQGYYQIELSKEKRLKTVFVTPDGKYQYKRLSMGLAESPSYFQKLINTVIKDLKYHHCLGYFDDFPCMGHTFDNFCESLHLLLQQLEKYNLKARISKCSFELTSLDFQDIQYQELE